MRAHKLFVFVIVIVLIVSTRVIKAQTYYPIISKDKKWGFINKKGNVKIYPQFDSVRLFHENMAAVMIGNKWGYIDTNGTILIKPVFENAYSFNDGTALVRSNSLFGYIKSDGKFLIFPQYVDGFSFNENRALVKSQNRKWIVIDVNNTVVSKEIAYNENEAGINRGYYFNSGILIIPESEYESKIIQIVNKKGRDLRIPKLNLSTNGYSDSLILFEKNGLFGYLGINYKKIIKEQYDYATDFLDFNAWVINCVSTGYLIKMIDRTNNVIFEHLIKSDSINLSAIINIGNKMCIIVCTIDDNKKFLILNSDGKSLSLSVSDLDYLLSFEDKYPYFKQNQTNLFLIYQDGIYKCINIEGKTLWTQ